MCKESLPLTDYYKGRYKSGKFFFGEEALEWRKGDAKIKINTSSCECNDALKEIFKEKRELIIEWLYKNHGQFNSGLEWREAFLKFLNKTL